MKSLHTDEEIEFVFLYRRALNEKKLPQTLGDGVGTLPQTVVNYQLTRR